MEFRNKKGREINRWVNKRKLMSRESPPEVDQGSAGMEI